MCCAITSVSCCADTSELNRRIDQKRFVSAYPNHPGNDVRGTLHESRNQQRQSDPGERMLRAAEVQGEPGVSRATVQAFNYGPPERRVNSVIVLDSFISFMAYWWPGPL